MIKNILSAFEKGPARIETSGPLNFKKNIQYYIHNLCYRKNITFIYPNQNLLAQTLCAGTHDGMVKYHPFQLA